MKFIGNSKGVLLAAAMLLVGGAAQLASAAFTMTISQVGSNVIGTGSGTINTSALTVTHTAINDNSRINPSFEFGSEAMLGPGGGVFGDANVGISGPSTFGSGPDTVPNVAASGDLVGVVANNLVYTPNNYVSGSALSDSDTWGSTTLATLGITPGTYTWTWGTGPTADSFTLIAAVPEPTSIGLLALVSLGLVRWPRPRRVM